MCERGPTYGLPRKAEFLNVVRELNVDDRMCVLCLDVVPEWLLKRMNNRKHVGEMGEGEMDEYIGFCEGALLGRQVELDGLFPLGGRSEKRESKRKGYRRR